MTDVELAARLEVLRRYGASGLEWEEPGPGGSKLAYKVMLYQGRAEPTAQATDEAAAPVVEEKPLPTAAELALDPGRAKEFGAAPAGDDE